MRVVSFPSTVGVNTTVEISDSTSRVRLYLIYPLIPAGMYY